MTSPLTLVRSAFKRIGVGALFLRLRRAIRFGFRAEVATLIAKWRYLRAIKHATPLTSDNGEIDCFMLLNEARFWEGIWALYSFRAFFGSCRIVVLDDGTLKPKSHTVLESLFPGIEIPEVAGHDNMVISRLEKLGLKRCLQWRQQFVFFRKLVDPCLLAKGEGLILLDSDCLHFRVPNEVQEWSENPIQVQFIADRARHSFCATHENLSLICGALLPEYFCAGYVCLPRHAIQLRRVEEYLASPCFEVQLSTGEFSHVAEQTLQAMEAAVNGTEVLPETYATCPNVPTSNAVAGHYCGGSVERTWFYTKGLHVLAAKLIANPRIHG